MFDAMLANWRVALSVLDMTDTEVDAQLQSVGTLLSIKLAKLLSETNDTVSIETLSNVFSQLSTQDKQHYLEKAMDDTLRVYASKIESLYSAEKKDAFLSALHQNIH